MDHYEFKASLAYRQRLHRDILTSKTKIIFEIVSIGRVPQIDQTHNFQVSTKLHVQTIPGSTKRWCRCRRVIPKTPCVHCATSLLPCVTYSEVWLGRFPHLKIENNIYTISRRWPSWLKPPLWIWGFWKTYLTRLNHNSCLHYIVFKVCIIFSLTQNIDQNCHHFGDIKIIKDTLTDNNKTSIPPQLMPYGKVHRLKGISKSKPHRL